MYNKIKKNEICFCLFLLLLFLIPEPVFAFIPKVNRIDVGKKYELPPDSSLTDSMESNRRRTKSSFIYRPKILSFKYTGGQVLKSNESVRGNNTISYAQYVEAKFGFSSLGNRWKDIAYGMPYYGIGIGVYDFNRSDLGHPISVYLYHGGLLYNFSSALQLKYEWNLGTSLNWKTHDPIKNPRNNCMGSDVNVYFAGNLYLNWILSSHWDLNMGLSVNHVSNGARKMPNEGLNTFGAFIGLTYNFDRERVLREYNPFLIIPQFRNRFVSDITVHGTKRQRSLPTTLTKLSSSHIRHDFLVLGINYALLHMPGYKYRYGLGLDGTYDESADFSAWKKETTENGDEIVDISYGKTRNRFALGLSIRGDMVFPKYTVSAQVGYNVIHNNKYDKRFYQSISVKIPFWEGLYGSFSVRSKNISKSQYLFFGFGYLLDHK